MASFFYAMHRILRLRQPLLATIHSAEFSAIAKHPKNCGYCVRDIEHPKLFRAIYILLRAIFPALCCLRFCDSNEPCMDKIFTLVHRTTLAIEASIEALDDYELFGSFALDKVPEDLKNELNEVFGNSDEDGKTAELVFCA